MAVLYVMSFIDEMIRAVSATDPIKFLINNSCVQSFAN